tara:strand:+ start:176 stop:376 length:201 start_codon:yes stop_codon:yes gene_type:complete
MRALRKITAKNIPLREGAILFGTHEIFFFKKKKQLGLRTKLSMVKLDKRNSTSHPETGIVRLKNIF